MTDWAQLLFNILNTNWIDANVTRPAEFYYKTNIANRTLSGFSCKVYLADPIPPIPQGLGWTSNHKAWRVSIDIRGGDRDRMLKTVDEITRILELRSVRIGDGITYDLLKNFGAKPVAEFSNYHQWVNDVQFERLVVPLS